MNKIIFIISSLVLSLIIALFYDANALIIDYTYFSNDEFRYYNLSNNLWAAIDEYGYSEPFSNYYKYTGSHHFIYYFILASFIGYVGDIAILFVLFKVILHMCAIVFFHRWLRKVNGYNNYFLILFMILAYVPLSLLTISIMRDSLIFLLLAIGLYSVHEKNIFIFCAVFIITMGFRSNAALALLAYFFMSNLFLFKEMSFLKKGMTIGFMLIISISVIPINRIQSIIIHFFEVNWGVEIIRFFFSPLPWSIDPELPGILTPWYSISLFFVLLLLIVNVILLTNKNRGPFKPISLPLLVFLSAYSVPYILIGNLGFRQLAVILPFVFIYNVTYLIQEFKMNKF